MQVKVWLGQVKLGYTKKKKISNVLYDQKQGVGQGAVPRINKRYYGEDVKFYRVT